MADTVSTVFALQHHTSYAWFVDPKNQFSAHDLSESHYHLHTYVPARSNVHPMMAKQWWPPSLYQLMINLIAIEDHLKMTTTTTTTTASVTTSSVPSASPPSSSLSSLSNLLFDVSINGCLLMDNWSGLIWRYNDTNIRNYITMITNQRHQLFSDYDRDQAAAPLPRTVDDPEKSKNQRKKQKRKAAAAAKKKKEETKQKTMNEDTKNSSNTTTINDKDGEDDDDDAIDEKKDQDSPIVISSTSSSPPSRLPSFLPTASVLERNQWIQSKMKTHLDRLWSNGDVPIAQLYYLVSQGSALPSQSFTTVELPLSGATHAWSDTSIQRQSSTHASLITPLMEQLISSNHVWALHKFGQGLALQGLRSSSEVLHATGYSKDLERGIDLMQRAATQGSLSSLRALAKVCDQQEDLLRRRQPERYIDERKWFLQRAIDCYSVLQVVSKNGDGDGHIIDDNSLVNLIDHLSLQLRALS
jgi:hypothetical protein